MVNNQKTNKTNFNQIGVYEKTTHAVFGRTFSSDATLVALAILFASYKKDVLGRPPLTSCEDNNFWRSESGLRFSFIGKTYPPEWGSSTNTSDAPVMRLAEVVLNWIEAKAVLAQHMGGVAVSQADLDKSVNAIRNRTLEAAAVLFLPTQREMLMFLL